MVLASTDSDRIAGALLNDIGPEINPAGLDRIGTYVGKDVMFESWDDATARLRERNEDMFPNWTDGEWHRFGRRIAYEADDGIRFQYDMGIADNFRLATETPSSDAWPMLRALAGRPVTILRGALSDLFSQQVAERIVSELGGDAELVIIPDTGHAPSLEEPEALAALDRLLERVSAREA